MIVNKASFRDPSGFVFEDGGKIYRQINKVGAQDYELAVSTGLYSKLMDNNLLIRHVEIDNNKDTSNQLTHKTLQSEKINFISYPYEWCFEQIKDAALLTLKIQKIALEHGMTLKDATSYNIQFKDGQPIFIDTLSFEAYTEGSPWAAYRQFCQHFLATLSLMKYVDLHCSNLLKIYMDGIPLDVACKLLPFKTKFIPTLLLHIHVHSKSQKKHEDTGASKNKSSTAKLAKNSLITLINSLEFFIAGLQIKNINTEWGDYYNDTNYTDNSFKLKADIVSDYINYAKPKYLWDFGANTGIFSRLASDRNISTISFDIDPIAVNKNYHHVKSSKENNILPLILDLTNPSSNIGWNNEERSSIKSRSRPDLIMALALIHHLAISNNVPMSKLASFFSELSEYLIIEFVPKGDSQVERILSSRKDIFDNYTTSCFEGEFQKHFDIVKSTPIAGTHRTLYLLKRKGVKK